MMQNQKSFLTVNLSELTRADGIEVKTVEKSVSASDDPSIPQRQKRAWTKISDRQRLELKICVGFGLPVDFAGKVLDLGARNANRIMKGHQARERLVVKNSEGTGAGDDSEQTEGTIRWLDQTEAYQKAEQDALFALTRARTAGIISKRNEDKINAKFNRKLQKYLDCEVEHFHPNTLPEKVFKQSGGLLKQRTLPRPDTTVLGYSTSRLSLKQSKRFTQRDLELWHTLPDDLKSQDRQWMAKMLF